MYMSPHEEHRRACEQPANLPKLQCLELSNASEFLVVPNYGQHGVVKQSHSVRPDLIRCVHTTSQLTETCRFDRFTRGTCLAGWA